MTHKLIVEHVQEIISTQLLKTVYVNVMQNMFLIIMVNVNYVLILLMVVHYAIVHKNVKNVTQNLTSTNNLMHKANVNVEQHFIRMVNNVIYVLFILLIVVNAHKLVICVQSVIPTKTETSNQMIKVNVIVLIFIIKVKMYAHYVINIKNVFNVKIKTLVMYVMIKIIGLRMRIINVNVLEDIMRIIINANYVMLLGVLHALLISNVINV